MNKKLVVIAASLLIVALLVVISAFTFGLGGFSSKPASTSYESYDLSNSGLKSQNEYVLSADSRESGKSGLDENAISFDRKIISTAHLQIEVRNVQTAFNNITGIASGYGGYISGSSIYGNEESKSGNIVVRIPQKSFYAAVGQIEGLGVLKSRSIQGQDVTEEYIDISARLGNLQKQETRLSEILKMANTVKDVLEVEKELERVRGEIERLTGRKNYLEESIEMSTITVNANEPAPFFEGWGIAEASREAVGGFFNMINVLVIFTGYILPILAYIAVAILIWRGLRDKVITRFFGK